MILLLFTPYPTAPPEPEQRPRYGRRVTIPPVRPDDDDEVALLAVLARFSRRT